mgnify:CR=1 FL=1
MVGENLKFLSDRMLGKLAKYLLMLGFDTLYFTKNDPFQLIDLAVKQNRIILSRDTKLKRFLNLPEHLFITEDLPEKQFRQVVESFKLRLDQKKLFTRCLCCNQRLLKKTPEEVKHLVPQYILTIHREFSICPQCKRVYWRGSHQKGMEEIIKKVFRDSRIQ